MGSLLYDFLTDSFLFDQSARADSYSKWSDEELRKELTRYREYALGNLDKLSSEIAGSDSGLRVFHPDTGATIELLKQTALYVDQVVVADPLFEKTHQPSAVGNAMNQYLGFRKPEFDRKRLVQSVAFLQDATPMVAGNFLKLLPTTYFSEPPAQPPIYYSENNYEDGIPAPILGFLRSKARVSSLEQIGSHWASRGDFYPCRAIDVMFPGHERGMMYYLFEQEVLKTYEVGGNQMAEFRQYLPKEPPSKAQFELWVSQSINRAANAVLKETMREVDFAVSHASNLLTKSPFKAELLNAQFEIEKSVQNEALNSFFEMKLPFLDGVSANAIMEVRLNDGQAFQNFRTELEKQLRELRTIKDPEVLRLKKENLVHELSETQVRVVGQKMHFLKKKLFVDASLMFGGLIGSVQSGGWSLLASALAVAKGYQTVQEYHQSKQQNPAFFLWKVLNK
ncbi:MAG TPA: hypothetical protein VFW05_03990 [Verrucomicrobiae bacterium]|nr:hypothetical protein [Verrucomicrobiae bacterium]